MVYDLPWCSLVGRNVKREQTLCVRLNRVIVGKLENNITEAEVRVRRLWLFGSSISQCRPKARFISPLNDPTTLPPIDYLGYVLYCDLKSDQRLNYIPDLFT